MSTTTTFEPTIDLGDTYPMPTEATVPAELDHYLTLLTAIEIAYAVAAVILAIAVLAAGLGVLRWGNAHGVRACTDRRRTRHMDTPRPVQPAPLPQRVNGTRTQEAVR